LEYLFLFLIVVPAILFLISLKVCQFYIAEIYPTRYYIKEDQSGNVEIVKRGFAKGFKYTHSIDIVSIKKKYRFSFEHTIDADNITYKIIVKVEAGYKHDTPDSLIKQLAINGTKGVLIEPQRIINQIKHELNMPEELNDNSISNNLSNDNYYVKVSTFLTEVKPK